MRRLAYTALVMVSFVAWLTADLLDRASGYLVIVGRRAAKLAGRVHS